MPALCFGKGRGSVSVCVCLLPVKLPEVGIVTMEAAECRHPRVAGEGKMAMFYWTFCFVLRQKLYTA